MTTRSDDAEVLLFSTPHCPACRAVRPTASSVAASYGDTVSFREVDARRDPATASLYDVSGVPTMVALHDAREVARLTGVGAEADIERLFDAAATGARSSRRIPTSERALRIGVAATFAAAAVLTGVVALWPFAAAAAVFAVWDLIRP